MSIFTHYRTLTPYLIRYRKQYCAGLLCLFVIITGELLVPQFIRLSIDSLTDNTTNTIRYIVNAMAQLVGVTLIIALGRFGWRHFLSITARKIETELRDDVYRKLTTLSHDFYASYSTGDIIARLTNDLRAIRMACGFAIVAIVDGLVMGIAIIILLLVQYPRLTIYMLAPLPLVSILVAISGKIITKRYSKVQEAFSSLTEKTRHALINMRTIKAHGKERYFEEKFNKYARQYKEHSLHYARFWSLIFPTVLFLATCSHVLLIIFGGREVINGQITIGDFTAIMTYLQLLLWPMVGLGFTINLFAQGAASLERVNAFFHAKPLITSAKNARKLKDRFSIELQNLHYAYPNSPERVLHDISMTIPAGIHIGIIGKTAAGKSTFAQLLPRLLEAPPQTIHIADTDIRSYDLQQLRKQICLIPQQPFLFSESIEQNILFGITDEDSGKGVNGADNTTPSTSAQVDLFARIIDAAAIDPNSPEFPQGLSTEIGENGIMISGGQKQRVAIARALIIDPPMVIFDDTFSALDAETEERVTKNVRALRAGKTTIFISNRVQSIEQCEAIYVFGKGTIIQQGDYESLTNQPGLFQDLYNLQIPTKLERKA